ncbi:suppressor of glycerol defect [Boothiomyces macroporosus]|uniref:Suppressor of glycerol defect n=1 Tax=Boothiomyces macroporosus TaxID=261099 RepID=A0AAD5UMC2_9FUNG|nr:suppressor of glycerol defect [Boothiomyces macroporosus]
MKPKNKNTTALPASLKEMLTDKDERFDKRYKKTDRKLKRKEARLQKKVQKSNYYQKKEVKEIPKPIKKPIQSQKPSVKDPELRQRQLKKLSETNPQFFKLLTDSSLVSKQMLLKSGIEQEITPDEDEQTIIDLEKKLKIKKGKLKGVFKKDGLDYLLGDGLGGLGGFGQEESEDEFGKDMGLGAIEGDVDHTEDINSDINESEDGFNGFEEGDELDEGDYESEVDDESEVDVDESEEEDIDDSEMDIDQEEEEQSGQESETQKLEIDYLDEKRKQKTKSTLDIYGQNVTKAYVPPHLRPKTADTNSKLKKQLLGLLNRLSDANISSIVSGVQECYMSNPRHDVTDLVTEIVLGYIGDSANLLDSFSCTYACFIYLLFNISGVEFGAHFVQTLVEKYEISRNQVLASNDDERTNKQCTNYITFFGYLYCFGVVSCILVYDLIKLSIEEMHEIDVEILLRLLKICGSQLRSDDPTALKDIILMVKEKSEAKEKTVRMKFMIETIMELKNNKKNQQKSVQFQQLKKIAGSIIQKNTAFGGLEALRVSLQDIRDINVKGKWWLVGAAWKGNLDQPAKKDDEPKSDLLQLALDQKMNTDVRKSIFVTIMSSQDCMDAYERLLKLNLKEKQQRDIIRVLVHCCQSEKVYNPYYTLTLNQFLANNIPNKITFQYTLWDAIKLIEKMDDDLEEKRKILNLAKLLADLILSDVISLSVLKTVNFSKLNSNLSFFLTSCFHTILTKKGTKLKPDLALEKNLNGLKGMTGIEEFKDGLYLFLGQKFSQPRNTSDPGAYKRRLKLLKSITK